MVFLDVVLLDVVLLDVVFLDMTFIDIVLLLMMFSDASQKRFFLVNYKTSSNHFIVYGV
jgi:hypothetical protein